MWVHNVKFVEKKPGRQLVTSDSVAWPRVCVCVCVCVCAILTASTQCNPTRWPQDCMYVDRGRMLYGLWIHFVLLVCLFVSLPVRLFVCQPVCSSACLPLFVRLSIGRLCSIWLFDFFLFLFPPYLSYFYLFHLNICLTLCPDVSLAVFPPYQSLTCQSLLTICLYCLSSSF